MGIGFLGTAFFIGVLIGSFFISHLGDTLGRIKTIQYSTSFTILADLFLIYIAKGFYLSWLALFLIGFLSVARIYPAFLYTQEITPESLRNIAGSFNNVIDAFTMIVAALFFKYISKNWMHLATLYLVSAFIGLMLSFKLPESPKFLVSVHRYEEARDSFNEIARLNGK